MDTKETELREQIAYYKNKFVTDGNENKALREENARLKAELEMLKAQQMLLP
jgi:predicted nuclease with TOPRIM domain